MRQFEYVRPSNVQETCALLAEHAEKSAVLAGGQSLLPDIRQGEAHVDCVVDINDLDGHDYVRRSDGAIEIGCLARYRDILDSAAVATDCPILRDAVEGIGDIQVRNRGTICGSLSQAEPAGDPPVVVTALDADLVVASADGTRTVDGRSFVTGVSETALADDELVIRIEFPIVEPPYGGAYETYEPAGVAFPVASVAAVVGLEEGTIADATIVTGAVEGKPTPIEEAASALEGAEPTDDVLETAAERVREAVSPIEDAEGSASFKREICRTLTYRALQTATERALGDA